MRRLLHLGVFSRTLPEPGWLANLGGGCGGQATRETESREGLGQAQAQQGAASIL